MIRKIESSSSSSKFQKLQTNPTYTYIRYLQEKHGSHKAYLLGIIYELQFENAIRRIFINMYLIIYCYQIIKLFKIDEPILHMYLSYVLGKD